MIAKDLRVSERSVERWRRAWQGGMDALACAGPPELPKPSDEQFIDLKQELALGPCGSVRSEKAQLRSQPPSVLPESYRTESAPLL